MDFQLITSDYANSGGGCMVEVCRMWLPEENRTVFTIANEAGVELTTCDYIFEVSMDDFKDATIETMSIEDVPVAVRSKYFKVMVAGFLEFVKANYAACGHVAEVPFELLPKDAKSSVTDSYRMWVDLERSGLYATDGTDLLFDQNWNSTLHNKTQYIDTLYAVKDRLNAFNAAASSLTEILDHVDLDTLDAATASYPLQKDFAEIASDIGNWVNCSNMELTALVARKIGE